MLYHEPGMPLNETRHACRHYPKHYVSFSTDQIGLAVRVYAGIYHFGDLKTRVFHIDMVTMS